MGVEFALLKIGELSAEDARELTFRQLIREKF